jgi:hypothetical protein
VRKRIEEAFAWIKSTGGLRKSPASRHGAAPLPTVISARGSIQAATNLAKG